MPLGLSEKQKYVADSGKAFGALWTVLFKPFECFNHELVIPNLNAYGISLSTLKLVLTCFSYRKQRSKVSRSYSS